MWILSPQVLVGSRSTHCVLSFIRLLRRHFATIWRRVAKKSAATLKPIRIGSKRALQLARQRDAVELLGWAVCVLPILAFVADGGFNGLVDLQTGLNVVNRLTALAGTSLLLVHLLLVSRLPMVERVLGLDQMTGAHKRLGKPVLYLLLVHALTSVATYAMADGEALMETFIKLNLGYPSLLMASIGLLLMIMVVVTSIRAARRRFSYEAWYLIHLLAYVSVGIAVPHQFEFGTELLGNIWLQAYFIALYVFTTLSILMFRILAPILQSWRMNLRVSEVVPDRNNTSSIHVSGRGINRLEAEAGQFFMLRVLTPSQWWRPHPFSVSAPPNNSEIRFTIGNRGDDTAQLQLLKPGTRVILEGPYGIFSERKRTKPNVVLMAAGIGVSPVRALAENLAAEPGDVTVIYRASSKADAALLSELEEIADRRGHALHLLTGESGKQREWIPQAMLGKRPPYAVLVELAPNILDSDIYICGPVAWARQVVKTLDQLNVPENQIHVEEFAW